MTINNKFDIEDEVVLKTDPEGLKRLIVGITIRPGNQLLYEVQIETYNSWHYEFELELCEL